MEQVFAQETTPARAYIVLLMGVAAVSLGAIFIRLAQGEGLPSLVIATGRLSVAALLLTLEVLRRADYRAQVRGLSRGDVGLILVAGFFLAAHFATWITSLEYTTVLISVVLVTTTPIWVALLERVFLRGQLPPAVLVGLAIVLTGGAMIALNGGDGGPASDPLLGGALALLGAVAVAVYLVVGRKLRATLSLTPYICLVYGTGALALLAGVLLTGAEITGYSAAGYGWVVAVALVPQLIGHSALNYALAYLPATYVSISTQLEPVLSAIAAYFIFAEAPGFWQVAGGAVIMTGVLVASVGQSRAARALKRLNP